MPVAVVMDFKDATLDQSDQVIVKMGFTPGGAGPPGALFHWVAGSEDGMRVVDVLETREQFERFAGEQIGPLLRGGRYPQPAGHSLPRRPQPPDRRLSLTRRAGRRFAVALRQRLGGSSYPTRTPPPRSELGPPPASPMSSGRVAAGAPPPRARQRPDALGERRPAR
jgi:hypothetical protein